MEVLCRAGFDFVGMDGQHGFFDFDRAARAIQIANAFGVPIIYRVPLEHMSWAPRYLDAGADGIMIAMVGSAWDVERAVELSRYQPGGKRSFGGGKRNGVGEPPGEDPTVVMAPVYIMVETLAAVENLEEIAEVPGLSGMFIGPTDMALALGRGYPPRSDDQELISVAQRVIKVADDRGLRAGIFANDGNDARDWAAAGFTDIILSSDIGLLRGAVRDHLGRARGT
jgi:4-hydroxy-2-oxoheptanedioate aldolase